MALGWQQQSEASESTNVYDEIVPCRVAWAIYGISPFIARSYILCTVIGYFGCPLRKTMILFSVRRRIGRKKGIFSGL
jgi:hypothetical protein